ncbi:MAG TPA: YHS domain-containing (seleno)protein [Burkholderiales bacterium]|nr:YHS domain-containing (seleno)protein [Burkholderiales bacterium]
MQRSPARLIATAATSIALWLGATPALAVKTTGGEYNTLYADLGAKGYDVVSYFTDGRPTQGSDRYSYEYGGVKWRFASREHRDMFAADPQRYAPQYGGFCSWGVSVGKLFDVDPVNGWTVVDGKLYLNFNREINEKFAGDPHGFVEKADRNWPSLNR